MAIDLRHDDVFENAFQYAAIGMALVSPEGRWLRVNRALCGITGYSEAELLQTTFQEITHPDDLDTDLGYLQQLINGDIDHYVMEKRYYHEQGHIIWVLLSVSLIRDKNGDPDFFISQIQDISDRIQTLNDLRESEQRLELALAGAELGTWDWNIKTGQVTFNERWAEMLGYSLDELTADVSTWETLVHPQDLPEVRKVLSQHLRAESEIYETRHRMRHKDGHWIWVLDKGKVIERDSDGNPVRACGTHLDITKRKEFEQQIVEQAEQLRIANEQLDRLAHIDSLTNLYNRRAFTARLNEEARRANRSQMPLSLLMIDIDDFKSYNDTYGHPEGDILLQQIAAVIQCNTRSSDIAARIGGEEFAIILPETDKDNATLVADKMRRTIAAHPWDLHPITVSIGVTTRSIEDNMPTETSSLLSEADTALYYSKRHGKNQVTHIESVINSQG